MDDGCVAGPASETNMSSRLRGGNRHTTRSSVRAPRQSRRAQRYDAFDDDEEYDQRVSGFDSHYRGAARGSFRQEGMDDRPVFERKSFGGPRAASRHEAPRDLREIHVVAPSMHSVPLPRNATVGDLREVLGGKLSPAFLDDRTKVSVIGGTLLPVEVSDDYEVAGAVQFNADTESGSIPVFHFSLPDDTHYEDFDAKNLSQEIRPRFTRKGGASADNMEVFVAYPHHVNVRFDAHDDALESVVRAVGEAVYSANRYPVYKVTEGKPLGFHLAYSDGGSSRVVQHLDHRHAQNGKASFVQIVDEETGSVDGKGAADLLFHAIPHHS